MKNLLLIVLCLVVFSCSNSGPVSNAVIEAPKKVYLDKLKWLSGKWQGGNDSIVMHEYWDYLSDSLMNGKSVVVFKGDTVFSEKIVLDANDHETFYRVATSGNIDVVNFKLTEVKNDTFVFENKQHDFPQRILYFQKGADSLIAKIEGEIQGTYQKQFFRFKKV